MVNEERKPSLSACSRRIRRKTEWKVPMMSLRATVQPSNCAMRSFISPAALLVKVSAMIRDGS